VNTQLPTRLALIALVAIGLVRGFLVARFYPDNPFSPVAVGAGVALTIVSFAWFRADSNRRGYKRSLFLTTVIVALPVFALPYYLFRSRGPKHGALATGVMLLSLIAYVIASHVGAYFARANWT
jgi:hypothetical protein